VKRISESLGVTRSQLTVRLNPKTVSDRRLGVLDDTAVVEEIRTEVSELLSYGYRGVWGLLCRRRETQSQARINVKRVYRVMRDH
jgi:putative transposase